MEKLIKSLNPGKNFLGLWVYRKYNHRKSKVQWTVTLWGGNNEYYETGLHCDPKLALLEAREILKRTSKHEQATTQNGCQ